MFRILSLDGGGIKGAFTASVLSCFLDQPLDKIDVLSIGTPFAPFSIAKNRKAGIIKWNVGMIDLMFEAQAQTATAQARAAPCHVAGRSSVMIRLPGAAS